MKNLFLSVLLLSTFAGFSQSDSGFGLKAGLNYNSNGDLIAEFSDAGEDIITENSDSKV